MAVKRKKAKKHESEDRMKRAMKIKCCYCDAKEECKFRKNKEESEARGVITYCTTTPNAKKQKRKPKQESLFETMLKENKPGFKKPFKKGFNKNKRPQVQ